MPQPKSSRARSGSQRKTAASKRASASSAKRKPAAKKASAAKRKPAAKPAARKSTSRKATTRKATTRKTAARKTAARKSPARKAAARRSSRAASSQDAVRANLDAFRDALSRGVIAPLDLVMLSRERVQEVADEAVERGRITRSDAEELVRDLVKRGRKQTEDVLADLEGLLDSARETARKRAGTAARRVAKAPQVDRVVREADRARRAASLGPSFPITRYDDLTAAQVNDRLADITPAELRKVRDYERRNANRKSILEAIERRLG